MADRRLTRGSLPLTMIDGAITRTSPTMQVWWTDTTGREYGPARLAWTPPTTTPGGQPAHHHPITPPAPGTGCVALIPDGDRARAIIIAYH